MKDSQQLREKFRRYFLLNPGDIGPLGVSEEIKRARFFIDTMERFIASSETEEVRSLEREAQALSDEAKDEFWQWHYPIHWQDIFGVRIRSAFCSQLCSQIEAVLGDIAHRVQSIERCAIGVKDIKGSSNLDQHKRYLMTFAKFEGPSPELWKEAQFLFRIRNAHVHEQGYIGEIQKDEPFKQFLASLTGVAEENGFVELRTGSCVALVDVAERFLEALLGEYGAYRQRALTLDRLSRDPQL